MPKLDIAAGSLFVPIAQRRARVVLYLFEPTARDSYVSWGFFNAAFEQKEYIEPYIIETASSSTAAFSADVDESDDFMRPHFRRD